MTSEKDLFTQFFQRGFKAGQASQWRPIESAPKTGETILFYRTGAVDERGPSVGYWHQGAGKFCDDQDYLNLDEVKYYWMPIPEGPHE